MSRDDPRPIAAEAYQRILVPTDGSDGADYAADHGLMLAEALGATAHIISVVEEGSPPQRDHLRSSPEEVAAETVESVEERARGLDVRTETATLSGTTKEGILDYVDEYDVDLVVLATHGRTGIGHVLFGSVAEDLVRESPVPVLTVRPPQWQD